MSKENEENEQEEPLQEEEPNEFLEMGGGIELEPVEGEAPSDIPVQPHESPKEVVDRDITRDYDVLRDEEKKKQWSTEPCYGDQYQRYPETVRRIGPTLEVFDLSKEADLQTFNTLMAGAQNTAAPRSAVVMLERQWDESNHNWKILAQVLRFKYLKILEND